MGRRMLCKGIAASLLALLASSVFAGDLEGLRAVLVQKIGQFHIFGFFFCVQGNDLRAGENAVILFAVRPAICHAEPDDPAGTPAAPYLPTAVPAAVRFLRPAAPYFRSAVPAAVRSLPPVR